MNQYHSQEEESLQSQRMTIDEAQALVQLWAERQRERDRQASLPTVKDIADVLQIPVQEADLLLQEIRTRRAAADQQRVTPPVYRQRTGRPLILGTAIAGAVILVALLFLFLRVGMSSPEATAVTAPAIEMTPPAPTPMPPGTSMGSGMTPPAAGTEPAGSAPVPAGAESAPPGP